MSLPVIRLSAVISKTGLSRSTIYALQKIGDFPPSIKLSERSVGWLENEVDEWIAKRAERRFLLSGKGWAA